MSKSKKSFYSKAIERILGAIFLALIYGTITMPSEGICQLVEVPLSERIKDAQVIIEGRIIKSEGFDYNGSIHTAHTIELTKKFKGQISGNKVIFITPGGRLGNKIQVVTPTFDLNIGDYGLFLGVSKSFNLNTTIETIVSASYSQGFIKYNLANDLATDPFKIYTSVRNELYSEILKEIGDSYQFVETNTFGKSETSRTFAMLLSSFAPIHSFYGDIINIEGSGFGTNGEVFFTDNYGKQTAIASEIISWIPTRISVRVPSTAITGKIKVVNQFNETAISRDNIILNVHTSNYLVIDGVSQGVFTEGQEIKVYGSAFGKNMGSIYFTDATGNQTIASEIVSWSNNFIVVRIPKWANTGKIKLYTSEKDFVYSPMFVSVNTAPGQIVISNITNTKLNAGVGDILTINGSGFGEFSYKQNNSSGGLATMPAIIGFQSIKSVASPYLGSSAIYATASDIVSWSDDKIEVKVPSGVTSGKIFLQKSGRNEIVLSPTSISINYSISNIRNEYGVSFAPYLYNQNQKGGYNFIFAPKFKENLMAVDAFKRAMESWRCGSGINIDVDFTGTGTSCQLGNDKLNSVNFDTDCSLDKGVTAFTYRNYEYCSGNGQWLLTDMDIMFSASKQWNFTSFTTENSNSVNTFDFESASLSQIGNAIGIDWINNPSSVMHFASMPNRDKRNLNALVDVPAGRYLVNRAVTGCGSAMRPLLSGECKFPKSGTSDKPPVAAFEVIKRSGCAPFIAEFKTIGENAGNLIQWDIDNDGHIDYIGDNITHTYTKPGVYTIRLVVYNELTGLDIEIKQNWISVTKAPSIFVDKSSVATCYGETVLLNASGSDSYYWETNDGQKGYYQGFAFKPTGSTIVTVTGLTNEGCKISTTVPVTVYQLPGMELQTIQPVKGNDGAVVIYASSANPPYLYKMNNLGWQSSNTFTNLSSGTHIVYVQDGMGCMQSKMFTLNAVANCPTPGNLTYELMSNNSAQLTWTSSSNANSYTIFYQKEGNSGLMSQNAFTNTIDLYDLEPNSQYRARVAANCVNGSSNFSNDIVFRTTMSSTCRRPNVILSNVTSSSVMVDWSGSSEVWHRVYFTDNSTFTWSQIDIPAGYMKYTIENLKPNTYYQIYVLANCGNNVTVKSSVQEIKTLSPTSNCDATPNAKVNPGVIDAYISWDMTGAAIGYSVKWKLRESTKWRTMLFISTQNLFTIPNLIPNSAYDVIVKAICDGGESKEWVSNFVTKSSKDELNISMGEVAIYPNPSNGTFNLRNSVGWDNAQLVIFDLQGRLVFEDTLNGNEIPINTDLTEGLYILKISNKGSVMTRKLSIE